MKKHVRETHEILELAEHCYVRLRDGEVEKIVHVKLMEAFEKPNGTDNLELYLEIATNALAHAASLDKGEKVTCHAIYHGVLYTAPCSFLSIVTEEDTCLVVNASPQSLGLELRQHERYQVQGCARLTPQKGSGGISQILPMPMNISLGGFGMELADCSWQRGEEIGLHLRIFAERDNQADRSLPVVELTGKAMLRTQVDKRDGGKQYFGFSFSEVPGDEIQALAFWLKSHAVPMRKE